MNHLRGGSGAGEKDPRKRRFKKAVAPSPEGCTRKRGVHGCRSTRSVLPERGGAAVWDAILPRATRSARERARARRSAYPPAATCTPRTLALDEHLNLNLNLGVRRTHGAVVQRVSKRKFVEEAARRRVGERRCQRRLPRGEVENGALHMYAPQAPLHSPSHVRPRTLSSTSQTLPRTPYRAYAAAASWKIQPALLSLPARMGCRHFLLLPRTLDELEPER